MLINTSIEIDRPASEVWAVLGDRFDSAHVWSSDLRHSAPAGREIAPGVSYIRSCDVKGMGKIREKVLEFDPVGHVLAYEVTDGFPFFVGRGVNRWQLSSRGDRTLVKMSADIGTRGLIGSLMAPMLKMQMGRLLGRVAEDLKYFVENGAPHPRKTAP